ncbi:MAG TPA: CGP-CTERM sorting domain-containing protein, partial [Candidatus Korarchaeota archaeon]|nr:CGP-CTERM sorting domain-containing protein [Candidatus Korarchaeota archaeon]
MDRRSSPGILAAVVLMAILAAPYAPVAAQPQKGPAVDMIIVETRPSGDVAAADVALGRLDMYLKSLSPLVYEGLPSAWVENLKLVRNAGSLWEITMNPVHDEDKLYIVTVAGKEYFNPFAIREARFAMNYLINRKYLVDEILHGGGAPMFGPVGPSNPADKYFRPIYEKYGFTPEGDEEKGLQMINEAMEKAAAQLGGRLTKIEDRTAPAGYWWAFDGEPVTVKFFIRIEDERHEEGLYVANQIEKAGIKVERIEANFLKCIYTVYLTDPRDYEWNLYTAGWGSTGANKYVEGDVAWFYAPWYGWMPAYEVEGWWEWQNETIDNLTMDLLLGRVTSVEEYWDKMVKAVDIGVYESIRVFTVENWEYFPVNKQRVTRLGYDVVTGLWSYWPWRTVDTVDHVLKVAVEAQQAAMYTSAWNPIGGFDDVYSHAIWRAIHDSGSAIHPSEAEPMPVRVAWEVEKNYTISEEGEIVGNIDVPETAVVYDSLNNQWVPVGPDKKAAVRVTLHYTFSKWHHGIDMSMEDVKYIIGWAYEWAHLDEPGDRYYDEQYASSAAPYLDTIKGFEFVDDTTLVVYGDSVHVVSDNVTADYYVWWPTLPWEVWEAMSYIIVNGGPVTNNTYSWYKTEGAEYLSMITPSHVEDMRTAVEIMKGAGHIPDPIASEVTRMEAAKRY